MNRNKSNFTVTPLGVMGWIPAQGHHTCCYCLEYEDKLIVLDAGTGIARFGEPWGKAILENYKKVIILLSHYHLDHVIGLTYLHYAFKDKHVRIAGPGESIYGSDRSAEENLNRLITPPFFARRLKDFPSAPDIQNLEIGLNQIDGIRIETILQEHTDPSVGIKIEGTVCYLTDAACASHSRHFARKCKILLHEAWFDNREYESIVRRVEADPNAFNPLKQHSSAACAAETARDASVDSLLLIHLNPAYPDERLLEMEREAQTIFPNSHLAVESKKIHSI